MLDHGKKECDLRDPGSLHKAHSSRTFENCHRTAHVYLPSHNHVKCDCVESYYHVLIKHQFIFVLNGNFANCVLNESLLIMQLQFSLKIHLKTYGIMQGGYA